MQLLNEIDRRHIKAQLTRHVPLQASRLLVTQGQSMLLQTVLHLPIAQFDFPAMTVDLNNIGARKVHRINHRGQYLLILAVDSASQQAGFHPVRQLWPLLVCLWTGLEMHQLLTPQLAHHLILCALFELQQPVQPAACRAWSRPSE